MNYSTDMNTPDVLAEMNSMRNHMMADDKCKIEGLVDEISKYDIYDFICRTSSLNLLVENQNKSILFDTIIAGALTRDRESYSGTIQMSSSKFESVINRMNDMGLRCMIDPSENTFIERILYYGNHWIFPGINYYPGYCLQGFIDVLCLENHHFDLGFTRKVHQLINFVLVVSDLMVHSLGYDLRSITHIEQTSFKFPKALLSMNMKRCVRISHSLINDLISDESLKQSLFSEFSTGEMEQVICGDWQNFFAHPFLEANDETVIVLNPSILVSFLIHQMVIIAASYGIKDQFIDAYNNCIWMKCRKSVQQLGHKKIKESQYGITLINDRYRKEEIVTVGNNKLMFVQFVCDAGDNYTSNSMFGNAPINENGNPTTYERAEYFANKLQVSQDNDISQILVLNSFGRSIGSPIVKKEHQYSIRLSPFELYCISINERKHADFLPRYIAAKNRCLATPTTSLLSELNGIEIYTQNDHSFYMSDDVDVKAATLFFAPGDSLDYIIRAVKKEDRHLIGSWDGVHLEEVKLDDSVRHIYYSARRGKEPPKRVIEFDKVNVWITIGSIARMEEANVYYSITDAISYWLAEATPIINSMNFPTRSVCIHVLLTEPIEQYYYLPIEKAAFQDCIHYDRVNNEIRMTWKPLGYQMFSNIECNTEKEMIRSVLEELGAMCDKQIDLTMLDEQFINPLKRKIYATNLSEFPYLTPIDDDMKIISVEDENQLLDEIGAHFLSQPEYNVGRVPDDKRVEVSNQVVGFLYSLLKDETASLSPKYLYERVCYDLEIVMYNLMVQRRRYAYDIACYPENEEDYINQHSETNRVSIALKFFAEYIAAVPPSGSKALGTMQYDRILAICSLIITWAYNNDLFKYNIVNEPVSFLKSGRIGMPKTESDLLMKINVAARTKNLVNLSDPNISIYSPYNLMPDLQNQIDEAFEDEYGFSYLAFRQCIFAVQDYGNGLNDDVKRARRTDIVKAVTQHTQIQPCIVEKIIDLIVLTRREEFLKPPEPFTVHDVYPWRFNRELSFTRRPIIQYEDDLIWGNRQLDHMWRYSLDLICNGKYKARGSKLKCLIGKLSNMRGNDFNHQVYMKIKEMSNVIAKEKVSKIGGKKIADREKNTLGDIDVLYVVLDKKKIVVGEVKDFSFAKNPYEMDQEYRRIFVDGDKPCFMTKHERRAAWVREHIDDVKLHFNLNDDTWSVQTVMFTSEEIVSNAFYHQGKNIITYSSITEERVKSV